MPFAWFGGTDDEHAAEDRADVPTLSSEPLDEETRTRAARITEALHTPADFEQFRAAVVTPLLANMTEFGKTPYLSLNEFKAMGYNCVIYPVTTLRVAMHAVEQGTPFETVVEAQKIFDRAGFR